MDCRCSSTRGPGPSSCGPVLRRRWRRCSAPPKRPGWQGPDRLSGGSRWGERGRANGLNLSHVRRTLRLMHIHHPRCPIVVQRDGGPGGDAALRRRQRHGSRALPYGIGDETADVDVAVTAVVEDRVNGAVTGDSDSRKVAKVTAGDQDRRCPRVLSGIESLQHQVVVTSVEETVDHDGPTAGIGGKVDEASTSIATFTDVEGLRFGPSA